MAGSAAPEQTGTEADIVFGVDNHSERTTPPPTKALPEVDALKSSEEPLTMGVPTVIPKEENVRSPNESGPKPLVVKGLPGATGKLNLKRERLASHCMCRFWVHMAFILKCDKSSA